MDKQWYIYTMEYSIAMKMNELQLHSTMPLILTNMMLKKKKRLWFPQPSETEPGRNRKITDQSQELKLKLWLKILLQTKAQDQMASQANSIKHLDKS